MKVKRYIVGSLPEALPIIRSELGADAVILNTKEIRVGGFLGMFSKKKMEVIAAIDSGAASQAAETKPQLAAAKPISTVTAPVLRTAVAAPKPAAQAYAGVAAQRGASLPEALAAAPKKSAADGSGVASALSALATAGPAVAPTSGSSAKTFDSAGNAAAKRRMTESELADEIRDMKQWIVRLSKQQGSARSEALQALYDRLADQEVEGRWIDRLIDEAERRLEGTEHDRGNVWREARRILVEWLDGYRGQGIGEETRVLHFVGPTGVGKTTSIAKLAAEQTLKAGRKVGFITADTYRIAAVDQLRTYATILGVPLEVVFSPSEVTRAFKQLEDRELIFMDTAGRNFRNELYVSEVNSLLQTGDRSDTFLVLSLTGRYRDMSAVASNFAKYGVRNVLFTKQDETSAYGAILNLVLEHGLRPVYVAYGQTVPDDIAPFRPERYAEWVLGEEGDE